MAYVNFKQKYPGGYKDMDFTPYLYLWLAKDQTWVWDKNNEEYRLFVPDIDKDPWCDGELPVLAKIIQETKYFVTVEIQPHAHKKGKPFSSPYRQAIHKHDIWSGAIKVEPIEAIL